MKIGSDCSGECCVCACGDFCLAGHGDDDFSPASKEKIISNLKEGKYSQHREYMINYLRNNFGYEYKDRSGYSAETLQLIEEHELIHADIREWQHYEDQPLDDIKATDIDMLYFMVCICPESMSYGRGLGAFVYKDGRVFRFTYNIHTPHCKGPHRSNTFTNIDEVILNTRHGITTADTRESDFGSKAFWYHTPMECLKDEEISVRELMLSVQAYCRKMNFCEQLRKSDKAHERWENREKEVIGGGALGD